MLRLLAIAVLALAAPQTAEPVKPAGFVSAASGTGRWPAVAEYRADLPEHTLYRPAQLPGGALPLVLWGNGACRDNGLQHAQFLREVASHGYVVIALGRARAERPVGPPAPAPAGPPPPPRMGPDETHVGQMSDAIAWASRIPWIDTRRIAVMGHSCGGLQTIAMSADPRISTSVLFNSGIYNRAGPANRSNIAVEKADLAKIHAPIAYFLGGPTDIAYENALDDVARISHVPVFFGELPVGHGGTFWTEADGGDWGKVAVAWLDWQLKRDAAAGKTFSGADCGLCRDPRWKTSRKGM